MAGLDDHDHDARVKVPARVAVRLEGDRLHQEVGGILSIYAELNLATNPLDGIGQGLAVDSPGNVFIADALNRRVRRLDVRGIITTVAQMKTPLGLAVDAQGAVYVADAEDNLEFFASASLRLPVAAATGRRNRVRPR